MSSNDIQTEGDFHWRNTMRPLRFFALDARAAIPIFTLILPTGGMRQYLFFLTVFAMIIFLILERRGLTFAAAMRSIRRWVHGHKRPGLMWFKRRRMRDYG